MKKIYFLILMAFVFGQIIIKAQTVTWIPLTSGTTVPLIGVSAPNANICYVSGGSGKILKTINGGSTWISQTSGTIQSISSLYFVSIDTGYAVGDNGTALKTTNGGTTWSPMSVGSSNSFRCVFFLNSSTGFISGGGTSGEILKTTNGGVSWTSTNTSTSTLYGISFSSPTDGYIVDYNGLVVKTTNAGSSWITISTGLSVILADAEFTSSTTGYVVGRNGTLRQTTNAGSTWSNLTSGTTDALSAIRFLDLNNGFIVGGDISVNTGTILTTSNGGASWSSYNPGTSILYKMSFPNSNTGYVVGNNGTILKYTSNVGINEKQAAFLTFGNYPNPFNSFSTFDLGNYHFSDDATIELYNISGKLVKTISSQKGNKIVVEKDNLNSGTYIYKVLDGCKYIGSGKMTIE